MTLKGSTLVAHMMSILFEARNSCSFNSPDPSKSRDFKVSCQFSESLHSQKWQWKWMEKNLSGRNCSTFLDLDGKFRAIQHCWCPPKTIKFIEQQFDQSHISFMNFHSWTGKDRAAAFICITSSSKKVKIKVRHQLFQRPKLSGQYLYWWNSQIWVSCCSLIIHTINKLFGRGVETWQNFSDFFSSTKKATFSREMDLWSPATTIVM